jgi:hypothetical protein
MKNINIDLGGTMKLSSGLKSVALILSLSAGIAQAQWVDEVFVDVEGYMGRHAYSVDMGGITLGRVNYGYPAVNLGANKEILFPGMTLTAYLTTGPEGRADVTSNSGNTYKAGSKASGYGIKLGQTIWDTGFSPTWEIGYRDLKTDMNFKSLPGYLTSAQVNFDEKAMSYRLGLAYTGSGRFEVGAQYTKSTVDIHATANHNILGYLDQSLGIDKKETVGYVNYSYRFTPEWRTSIEAWAGTLDTNVSSHPWGGTLRIYRSFK